MAHIKNNKTILYKNKTEWLVEISFEIEKKQISEVYILCEKYNEFRDFWLMFSHSQAWR